MTDKIGHYEIIEEIGRGAMAIVWRARDQRLGRDVALKEPIAPQGITGELASELAERFVREGRAAARLNHPGVVTVYDAGIYEDRAIIVMEYVRGRTLTEVLAGGALPAEQAISFAHQLLDVVGYAHSQGIIHRDIKPDNVFLTQDGRVKLGDFGIARIGESSALTQAGQLLGTPGYMAPEQIKGEPVDNRADLFAVGAVLFEMLTGQNPFGATEGLAPTAVMFRVVQEDPPDSLMDAAGLTPELRRVLLAALAKDPDQRFARADDFRAALSGEFSPLQPASMFAASSGSSSHVGVPAHHANAVVSSHGYDLIQGSGRPGWLPYAAVIALGTVATVVLIAMANSGAGTPSAVPVVETGAPATTEAVAETPAADEPAAAAPAESAPSITEVAVVDEIDEWLRDWEAMNLTAYMSHYSSSFYSSYKGYDLAAWRRWKADAFTNYYMQDVAIDRLEVDVSGDRATATFMQTFTCDSHDGGYYTDYGRKTLRFAEEGGELKIVAEEWVGY